MVTSCPSCVTTFRISHDQLKARHGEVRCGKCDAVFDAFKTLASLPDEPPSVALAEPLPAPAARGEAESYSATEDSAGADSVQSTLDIGTAPSADLTPAQSYTVGSEPRAWQARANWYLHAAVLTLSAGFVLQLIYAMRSPLTSSWPSLRPVFERVCAFTGCSLSLPRRTEALAIESSDLKADPARAGVIVLTAVLRNRSSAPVEHPALELTLTNPQDQAIARRVFLPRDYLVRAADASRGMDALAEVNVHLDLDAGELKAAGYRLFLFYP